MDSSLPVFNWSLKKLLQSEPDSFNQAKIKILYIILLFSILKAVVVISVGAYLHQNFQLERGLVVLVVYTAFLKVLLSGRKFLRPLTHAMIWMGFALIWTNIFLFSKEVNIISLQFIFMLVVSSFYLLPLRFSLLYSILAILPTIIMTIYPQTSPLTIFAVEKLASPAFEIIVVLNFVTILIGHYLFRQSYITNLEEKEMLNFQLVGAVKEAQEAAQSKSDFLSTMSHELRTPLNSVIAISEMLLENIPAREKEENLLVLKNSATGLHSLINNILDFNKLGSEKVELEFIPVNLEKLLTEICQGLSFQAAQKNLEFVLEIDEKITGLSLICDPTRLTQIIYNLGGNAIKFTQEGRVTLSLKVLSFVEETVSLRFAVKDTGIGIHADQLEAIFEPFKQASTSTTRNFGGTGLGLAIIKRLLHLFNSDIRVQSSPGFGSEFSFELSLQMALTEENLSELNPETPDISALRILVAEDNHMNQVVLTKVLSRWQITPVFAMNGLEAVDKLSAGDFDLILMDLHMPVMDGYQATAIIRNLTDPVKARIRIIALSASASDDLNKKIEESGMDGFMLKPYKIEELYNQLKSETLRESLPGEAGNSDSLLTESMPRKTTNP